MCPGPFFLVPSYNDSQTFLQADVRSCSGVANNINPGCFPFIGVSGPRPWLLGALAHLYGVMGPVRNRAIMNVISYTNASHSCD